MDLTYTDRKNVFKTALALFTSINPFDMDSVEENKVHDAKETSQKVQEPSILESHTLAISVDKKELDVAGEFLAIHGEEHGVYTREEEKRVLRYIDWRLLPLMLVTQTVAPLDVSGLLDSKSGPPLLIETPEKSFE